MNCWFAYRCMFALALRRWVYALLFAGVCACSWAQAVGQENVQPKIETLELVLDEEELLLSAMMQFNLPTAMQEAVKKSLALVFVAEVRIVQNRWYWIDKEIVSVQRYFRLSYLPLERKWRVQLGLGTFSASKISISNKYDTLNQALRAMQSIHGWALAAATALDEEEEHDLQFIYTLDTESLPRPLQIALLGDSDWRLSIRKDLAFVPQQLSSPYSR